MGEPIEKQAPCACGYPYWLHEGKRLTCVVAISRCDGFRPVPSVEESQIAEQG